MSNTNDKFKKFKKIMLLMGGMTGSIALAAMATEIYIITNSNNRNIDKHITSDKSVENKPVIDSPKRDTTSLTIKP